MKTAPKGIEQDKNNTDQKYSRDKLNIPIIEESQKFIEKEEQEIIEKSSENIKKYESKARTWQRKYNNDHPQSKMRFKGLKDVATLKELIKVLGDAAYKIHEDPDDFLTYVLGKDYQKGGYEPDYDLVRNTAGKVKISHLEK